MDDKIKRYSQEITDLETYVKKLKKENDWIEAEMSFFGMEGTDYDFNRFNILEE